MGILRCCVSRCLNAKVVRAVLSWIFLDLLGHPMSSCSLSRCCSEVFCFNIRAFFLRYQWTDIEIFIINFDKISLYRSRILFVQDGHKVPIFKIKIYLLQTIESIYVTTTRWNTFTVNKFSIYVNQCTGSRLNTGKCYGRCVKTHRGTNLLDKLTCQGFSLS